MSEFSRELHATAAFNYPESLDAFSQNIPMAWVTKAVKETGRATVRKRRFPAEQAVWRVLGIGLMRNRSIHDVCDKLDLAFPSAELFQSWRGAGKNTHWLTPIKSKLR